MVAITSLFFNLLQSIIIIVALILVSLLLKMKSIITEDHKPLFGRLITDFALPALIFATLSRHAFNLDNLLPAGMMLGSKLACLMIAWLIGRSLHLERPQLGAFILVAGFGSSSTLGYSLISQTFPNNPNAMTDALIISELGAGIPIFTIGVAIAIFFGTHLSSSSQLRSGVMSFFTSPIFLSLVLGLAVSFLSIPLNNPIFALIYRVLDIIGGSLVLFVAITIGLMLKPIDSKTLLPLILAVAAVKLVIEPALAFAFVNIITVPSIESEVLLIESAMPSGTVAAVIAYRYGCDGSIASALVIATYVLSLFTIPIITMLMM